MDWLEEGNPFGACFSLTPCDCRSLGEQQRRSPIGLQIGSRDQREGQFQRDSSRNRSGRRAVQRGGPRRLLQPLPQPLLARAAAPPKPPWPVARRISCSGPLGRCPRLQPHHAPQRSVGSCCAAGQKSMEIFMLIYYLFSLLCNITYYLFLVSIL